MSVGEVMAQLVRQREIDSPFRRVAVVVEDRPLPTIVRSQCPLELAREISALHMDNRVGREQVARIVLGDLGDPDRKTRLTKQLFSLSDVERHTARPTVPLGCWPPRRARLVAVASMTRRTFVSWF